MKNINDINTLEDAIIMLKELYIATMTQFAILEGKIDRTNKEQVSSFEKILEKEMDAIVLSKEIEPEQKIKYIKSAIESTYHLDDKSKDELEDLYITAMVQKAISSGRLNKAENKEALEDNNMNDNIKDKEYNAQYDTDVDNEKILILQKQVKDNIEKLLENVSANDDEKEEEKKKKYLKIVIENMNNIKDNQEIDAKTKIEDFSKQYFEKLSERIDMIEGKPKDEKIILESIDELNLKIYDDKSESEEFNYGELVKDRKIKPRVIFQSGEMILKKMATYTTGKSQKQQESKVIGKIEQGKTSKYELITTSKTGQMVGMDFFGEENIEEQLQEEYNYLPSILAAIAKAKKEGREHIGEITIINKELGTAVVQYDDNLEQKVKELKEREEQEHKKEKQKQEPDNSNRQ